MRSSIGRPSSGFARIAGEHLVSAMNVRAQANIRGMVSLCYLTGNTPEPVNDYLSAQQFQIFKDHVRLMHLDEYVGYSTYAEIIRDLGDDLGVPHHMISTINGLAEDTAAEAVRYGKAIARYAPDIYVCGTDAVEGHLGLNPVGAARDSVTRVVDFSPVVQAKQATYKEGVAPTEVCCGQASKPVCRNTAVSPVGCRP